MSKQPPRVSRQVIADGTIGLESLRQRMNAAAALLGEGESLPEFAAGRDEVISAEVVTLVDATKGMDAFDVLDMMRQREVMEPRMGVMTEPNPSITVIEIIAVILLARGQRAPVAGEAGSAAKVPEKLHKAAEKILSVTNFALMLKGDTADDDLGKLMAEYQGGVLNIRNRQYLAFHDGLNEELFGEDAGLDLGLGFTHAEFLAVREAIDEEYVEDYFSAVEVVQEVSQGWSTGGARPQSEETVERGRAALYSLRATPGTRASFMVDEIAGRSGVPVAKTQLILDMFSEEFAATDPQAAMVEFLDGKNPFARAALVHDGAGNYLQLALTIGTDCFRHVVEESVKRAPQYPQYNEHRKHISEGRAVASLEQLLGAPAAQTDLHYFAPKVGQLTEALGALATNITSVGKDCEADALFLVGDVAVCVEVKASSFSEQSKQGDIDRIRRDLQSTIGSATIQAHRLEDLISTNGGLWLGDRTWLDLSHIREVRSIAVCLDDLGPLGLGLDALVRGGIITDEKFPWIVSLSDLSTIVQVADRPAEFLLYLRRRTEPSTSRRFLAIDELDLFMLFLSGGLYLDPDPDLVHSMYPKAPPPDRDEYRRFAAQADLIRVDTRTEPLDRWMERNVAPTGEPKPSFTSSAEILSLVDFLADGGKPGWLRVGADLLNLDSETQDALVKNIERIAAATRADHKYHSFSMCFAGAWGFPVIFGYTKEKGRPFEEAREGLEAYMVAKKHQVGADRALGLLFDETGLLLALRYANDLATDDVDLDALVAAMRLQPVQRAAPIPPSARRKTRRLNG